MSAKYDSEKFKEFFGTPIVLRDFVYKFDCFIREAYFAGACQYDAHQGDTLIGVSSTLQGAKEILWERAKVSMTVGADASGKPTVAIDTHLPKDAGLQAEEVREDT